VEHAHVIRLACVTKLLPATSWSQCRTLLCKIFTLLAVGTPLWLGQCWARHAVDSSAGADHSAFRWLISKTCRDPPSPFPTAHSLSIQFLPPCPFLPVSCWRALELRLTCLSPCGKNLLVYTQLMESIVTKCTQADHTLPVRGCQPVFSYTTGSTTSLMVAQCYIHLQAP
jgi:hypothetical protein